MRYFALQPSSEPVPRYTMTPENFVAPAPSEPLDAEEIKEAVKILLMSSGPPALIRIIGRTAYTAWVSCTSLIPILASDVKILVETAKNDSYVIWEPLTHQAPEDYHLMLKEISYCLIGIWNNNSRDHQKRAWDAVSDFAMRLLNWGMYDSVVISTLALHLSQLILRPALAINLLIKCGQSICLLLGQDKKQKVLLTQFLKIPLTIASHMSISTPAL